MKKCIIDSPNTEHLGKVALRNFRYYNKALVYKKRKIFACDYHWKLLRAIRYLYNDCKIPLSVLKTKSEKYIINLYFKKMRSEYGYNQKEIILK